MRHLMERGLAERRALAVVRMSASTLRYVSRPDRNVELRSRLSRTKKPSQTALCTAWPTALIEHTNPLAAR